eukprot:c11602_g1_i3.p1 GENE.c11602_g1_i3~~c11602_g1_i3.p1  ORF type:complete len:108 (-),score=16.63 c11602_g1_i3:151-432(-)
MEVCVSEGNCFEYTHFLPLFRGNHGPALKPALPFSRSVVVSLKPQQVIPFAQGCLKNVDPVSQMKDMGPRFFPPGSSFSLKSGYSLFLPPTYF